MPLCLCNTSKGQPCKNSAKVGSLYCSKHQDCKNPQAQTKTQEPKPTKKPIKVKPEPKPVVVVKPKDNKVSIGDKLIEATAKNDLPTVTEILSQPKLPQDYFIQVAMGEASRNGSLPIVMKILGVVGKLTDKQDILDAGLYEATTKGYLPIMKPILKAGALPGGAIFAATSNKNDNSGDVLQLLIDAGATLKDKANADEAIRGAIYGGNLNTLKNLVKMGVDIKKNLQKLLVMAAKLDKINIVEYLIFNGAETNDPDAIKQIIEDDQDHSEVLQLFIINEAIAGHDNDVTTLLKKSHQTKTDLGKILKTVAENATTDRSKIIKALIEAGADPNSIDLSKVKSAPNKVAIQFASYL